MASDGKVEFDTGLDTSGAEKDAKSFGKTMDSEMTKVGNSMESAGKKMSLAITLPATALAVAGTKMAIDLNSISGKYDVVFAGMEDDMNDFMKTVQAVVPVTETEFKKMTSDIADLLKPMGFTTEQATLMTKEFFKLASAIAAFNGLDPAEVMLDFQRAIVNGPAILSKYGISLNKAQSEQLGLAKAQELGITVTDDQASALGILVAGFEQSTDALEGFEENSKGLDVQIALLTRDIKELITNLGQLFIPILSKVVDWMLKAINAFKSLDNSTKKLILTIGGVVAAMGPMLLIGGKLLKILNPMNIVIGLLVISVGKLTSIFVGNRKEQQKLDDQTRKLGKTFGWLSDDQIAGMVEELELTDKQLAGLTGEVELSEAEWDDLAQTLNMTTTELQDTVIEARDAEEIMIDLARAGDITRKSFNEMLPLLEQTEALFGLTKEEAENLATELGEMSQQELVDFRKEIGLSFEEFEIFKAGLSNLEDIEALQTELGLTDEEFQKFANGVASGEVAFSDINGEISLFRMLLNGASITLDVFVSATKKAVSKIVEIWNIGLNLLTQFWNEHKEAIITIFQILVEPIIIFAQLVIQIIQDLLIFLSGLWEEHGEQIKQILRQLLEPILKFALVVAGIFKQLMLALADFWEEHKEQIMFILGLIIAGVLKVANLISLIWGTLVDILSKFWENWGDLIIAVLGWLLDKFLWFVEKIAIAFNLLVDTMTWLWENVISKILSALQWAVGKIIGFFESIFSAWDTMTTKISNAWNWLWDGITSATKGFVNGILGMVETMANGIAKALNIPIKGMNLIPGVNIPLIPPATIPRLENGGIVDSASGGTFAEIGEGANPEAVVPLTSDGITKFIGGLDLSGDLGIRGMGSILIENVTRVVLEVDGFTLAETVVKNIDDVVQLFQPIKQ